MASNTEQVRGEEADQAGKVKVPTRWLLPQTAGVGIIVIALVLILLSGQNAGDNNEPRSVLILAEPTAEEAYHSAVEVAEGHLPDAELFIVSAQWIKVGAGGSTESDWSFHFYSPSTQHLVLVSVSDGEAWLIRDSLSPYPVSTFTKNEWRVDSDAAIRVWWEDRGRDLVEQRPDADLMAQLRMSTDYCDRLVWLIAGVASGQEDALTTVINAVDGTIVSQ